MLESEKVKSMTRKEYLKKKKKEKSVLPWLKNIALLLVIVALSIYVINQLKVYNSVTDIANKMLEESKLIKTYKMYFMADTYEKDDNEKILYYYQGTDESRKELKSGKGLNSISIDSSNNLYGIKDKSLIKINTIEDTSEVICYEDVTNYILSGDSIFIYKDYGKSDKKTGIYNPKGEQIIEGTIYQMLCDESSIYVIEPSTTSRSLVKYSLNGNGKTVLSEKDIVTNIIQDDEYIYYSASSKKDCICKVSKSGGEVTTISSTSCLKDTTNFAKTNTMAVYNGNVLFVASGDNKVYITSEEADSVVVDNAVSQIQLNGRMLYFSLKDKIEIYRYNLEKSVLEKITSARTDEMICIN